MQVEAVAQALKAGKVVGLPTETVFGLAVSLWSETGVEKLISLKDRNIRSGKIFTLVPENISAITNYVIIPENVKREALGRIPGPLTAILPKNPDFEHFYFNNFEKIGVRIPDFPLFSQLLPQSGPLLLTSANPRGDQPARTARELKQTMPNVDFVIDLSPGNNPPSTVIDFTSNPPRILRP